MSKRASVLIAFAFLFIAIPPRASATGTNFTLNVMGALLNSFSPATCGAELGDTYDNFCPSGSCSCFQYDDPDKIEFTGNKVGSSEAGTVHFTRDGGSDGTGISGHTGLGCNPVFGEVQVPGSKDTETIYFNGSICAVLGNDSANNAAQKMEGGWSIHSSSHGIKAFGTLPIQQDRFQYALYWRDPLNPRCQSARSASAPAHRIPINLRGLANEH